MPVSMTCLSDYEKLYGHVFVKSLIAIQCNGANLSLQMFASNLHGLILIALDNHLQRNQPATLQLSICQKQYIFNLFRSPTPCTRHR